MTNLLEKNILILDGATGTELRRAGMPIGVCTEQWVLENPNALISLQRAYADAGSDIVYAPTFGLNRISLRSHGVGDADIRDWALKLVGFSREAVGGRCLIGGDIAPTGALPIPDGDITREDLIGVFAEQAEALENAGVDFFAVETQMSVYEAEAAVSAVQSVSRKPILISFTVTDIGRTICGDRLTDALEVFQAMGVVGFGINCCGDLNLLMELLAELQPGASIPLIAKPNAGRPKPMPGGDGYDMTPDELVAYVPRFTAAGARYIGGCCGTDPTHIKAIANNLRS